MASRRMKMIHRKNQKRKKKKKRDIQENEMRKNAEYNPQLKATRSSMNNPKKSRKVNIPIKKTREGATSREPDRPPYPVQGGTKEHGGCDVRTQIPSSILSKKRHD
jgi:hypothetical protein